MQEGPYVVVNNFLKKFQRNDPVIGQLASDHYIKPFGLVSQELSSLAFIKLILLPILGIIGRAFIYIKKRNQVITELKACY